MIVPGSPCLDCEERRIGCHGDGVCRKYMDYRKKVDRANAEYRKEQDGRVMLDTKTIREILKKKRKFRRSS